MGEHVNSRWPARLHVVTGKGGTGKTTVAAALALGLAASGRRTLLVEVESRQGIAQLFEVEPLPYKELRIAQVPAAVRCARSRSTRGGAAGVPRHVLPPGRGRPGAAQGGRDRLRHHDRARLRDVLLTGKVKEATTRSHDGRRVYDAVVLDAPATRPIGRFLNVTAETGQAHQGRPDQTQSEGVASLLRSPITSVHVVTLLEEMPVQETLDAIAELQGAEHLARPDHRERRPPALLTAGKVTKAELKRGLIDAGLADRRGTVDGLAAEAEAHLTRRELEESLRAELAEAGRPSDRAAPCCREASDRAGLDELASDTHRGP
jgi:hypothetical protein